MSIPIEFEWPDEDFKPTSDLELRIQVKSPDLISIAKEVYGDQVEEYEGRMLLTATMVAFVAGVDYARKQASSTQGETA